MDAILEATRHFAFLTGTAPALKLAAGGDGSSQRFRKELIRVGHYIKAHDNLDFEVTREALDHWVLSFNKMREAGVRVPVPVGHTENPEANRGWVHEMTREGDSLYGVIELVGTDAIAMAGRTDVSIYSPSLYVDGQGNQYVRPITHVALCTDPVVPGLDGFQAIAASLASIDPRKLTIFQRKEPIAMADPNMTTTAAPATTAAEPGDTTAALMNTLKAQMGKAFEAMELNDFITRARAIYKVKDQINNLLGDEDAANDQQAADAVAAVAASLRAVVGDNGARTDGQALTTLAASQTRSVDPLFVQLAADNRRMKIEARVQAGNATPAQAELLTKQFVGENGAAIALSLSKGIDDGFENVLAIFDASAGSPLGERTAAQVLGLSLGNPRNNSQKNALVADAEARAECADKARRRR